jgi:hypothetical protein
MRIGPSPAAVVKERPRRGWLGRQGAGGLGQGGCGHNSGHRDGCDSQAQNHGRFPR